MTIKWKSKIQRDRCSSTIWLGKHLVRFNYSRSSLVPIFEIDPRLAKGHKRRIVIFIMLSILKRLKIFEILYKNVKHYISNTIMIFTQLTFFVSTPSFRAVSIILLIFVEGFISLFNVSSTFFNTMVALPAGGIYPRCWKK